MADRNIAIHVEMSTEASLDGNQLEETTFMGSNVGNNSGEDSLDSLDVSNEYLDRDPAYLAKEDPKANVAPEIHSFGKALEETDSFIEESNKEMSLKLGGKTSMLKKGFLLSGSSKES